jgi:hypothetical protein
MKIQKKREGFFFFFFLGLWLVGYKADILAIVLRQWRGTNHKIIHLCLCLLVSLSRSLCVLCSRVACKLISPLQQVRLYYNNNSNNNNNNDNNNLYGNMVWFSKRTLLLIMAVMPQGTWSLSNKCNEEVTVFLFFVGETKNSNWNYTGCLSQSNFLGGTVKYGVITNVMSDYINLLVRIAHIICNHPSCFLSSLILLCVCVCVCPYE